MLIIVRWQEVTPYAFCYYTVYIFSWDPLLYPAVYIVLLCLYDKMNQVWACKYAPYRTDSCRVIVYLHRKQSPGGSQRTSRILLYTFSAGLLIFSLTEIFLREMVTARLLWMQILKWIESSWVSLHSYYYLKKSGAFKLSLQAFSVKIVPCPCFCFSWDDRYARLFTSFYISL